jgi:hypothetical protein
MNREQWLRKRNQVEMNGIAPAFGAPNFSGQTKSLDLLHCSGGEFAVIQQQHFGDELACDEWAMISRSPDPSHGGSH